MSCLLLRQEAVKREVLEETGLNMKPTTLLMVECASKAWFRFVLTGEVTGGSLKTPAQADSESLQAKWVKDIRELSLRSNDILPIIERARQFYCSAEPQYSNILPSLRAHSKLLLRLVVCIKQRSRYLSAFLKSHFLTINEIILSTELSKSITILGSTKVFVLV